VNVFQNTGSSVLNQTIDVIPNQGKNIGDVFSLRFCFRSK